MSGQATFPEEQVMRIVCAKLVEALATQRTPQAFFAATVSAFFIRAAS